MSLLKKNIIANLAGNGWSSILSIVVIPLYIHLMGIESYGLIGISMTLMALFSILDMGMNTTMTREMARLTAVPGKAGEIRDLARTLELLSWGFSVFIGILMFFLSYPIAYDWLRPGTLTPQSIRQAVILMGLSMVFQWPISYYSSGLIGLQKQVSLNVLSAAGTTMRCVGAVLVLWFISPTIQAFFIWHSVVNALQAIAAAFMLRHSLPRTEHRATFRLPLLKSLWRFAAGMGGITITGLIWSQIDKVILSKMLSLETFGYYSLAWVVATCFSRLMGPLVTAIFPRFTELVAKGDRIGLSRVYHGVCQLMSVLTAPTAVFIAFFASEIVILWTGNPVTAANTHLVITLLAMSTLFNGLSHIPLTLEYAHGRTNQVLLTGIAVQIILVPSLLLATGRFGVSGAAAVLMTVNFVYMVIITQLIHRHLLPDERGRWYVTDVGVPILVSVSVVGIGRFIISGVVAHSPLFLGMMIILLVAVSAAAVSAPMIRAHLFAYAANIHQRLRYEI